jgi:hypothetical protein
MEVSDITQEKLSHQIRGKAAGRREFEKWFRKHEKPGRMARLFETSLREEN